MRIDRSPAWMLAVVAAYVASWHAALLVVLAIDGMLTGPGVSVQELAPQYVAALPYLWRPGGELATYVQLLALVLTTLVLGGYVVRRTRGGGRPTRGIYSTP